MFAPPLVEIDISCDVGPPPFPLPLIDRCIEILAAAEAGLLYDESDSDFRTGLRLIGLAPFPIVADVAGDISGELSSGPSTSAFIGGELGQSELNCPFCRGDGRLKEW